jgi:hypothetical protein
MNREIIVNASSKNAKKPILEKWVQCLLPECPVDCELGEWQQGECSESCGNGTRILYREVLTHPAYGGKPCGEIKKIESFFLKHCPISL